MKLDDFVNLKTDEKKEKRVIKIYICIFDIKLYVPNTMNQTLFMYETKLAIQIIIIIVFPPKKIKKLIGYPMCKMTSVPCFEEKLKHKERVYKSFFHMINQTFPPCITIFYCLFYLLHY